MSSLAAAIDKSPILTAPSHEGMARLSWPGVYWIDLQKFTTRARACVPTMLIRTSYRTLRIPRARARSAREAATARNRPMHNSSSSGHLHGGGVRRRFIIPRSPLCSLDFAPLSNCLYDVGSYRRSQMARRSITNTSKQLPRSRCRLRTVRGRSGDVRRTGIEICTAVLRGTITGSVGEVTPLR